ncbi:MAG: hypothetical protein KAR35_04585 [Candidatus Heimdallarchaeota archaeon]|nr:hypothetical protein [Candidatus Heimdallarchaeota archaeon]MCK5048632.1 hypothetical protein [Candidatus Heimdallarchaeota archaeon]
MSTPKIIGADLLYFSIIKNSMPIFELNFQKDRHDSTLFAGFVSAFSHFAKDFSDSDLKIIDQGAIKIGIEEGSEVDIFYIAKEITSELQSKIRLVLMNFELEYALELQKEDIIDTSVFKTFREYALQIFSKESVKSYYIPIIIDNEIINDPLNFPKTWDIISAIDGIKTVSQIAELTETKMDLIIDTFAVLRTQQILDFKIIVNVYDILYVTEQGMRRIFGSIEERQGLVLMFGEESIDLLKEFNSKKSVLQCAQETKMNVIEAQELLSLLIMKGYVNKISEKTKTCLSMEYLFNLLLSSLRSEMDEKAYSIFNNSIQKVDDNILTNLIIIKKEKISFDLLIAFLNSDECSLESNEIFEVLIIPLSLIFDDVEKELGNVYTTILISQLFSEVNNRFGSSVVDAIGSSIAATSYNGL